MAENAKTQQFEYEDGNVWRNVKDKKTLIATFDEQTGALEFQLAEYSDKFRDGTFAVIGTVTGENNRPTDSGRRIKRISIKGVDLDKPKANEPAAPRRLKSMGDATPDFVKWMFKYRPKEAYVRYRVILNANGVPTRANVIRKTETILDDRDGRMGVENTDWTDGQGPGNGYRFSGGAKSFEKGPIVFEKTAERFENQIIAHRATCLTFLPSEIDRGGPLGESTSEYEDDDSPEAVESLASTQSVLEDDV